MHLQFEIEKQSFSLLPANDQIEIPEYFCQKLEC